MASAVAGATERTATAAADGVLAAEERIQEQRDADALYSVPATERDESLRGGEGPPGLDHALSYEDALRSVPPEVLAEERARRRRADRRRKVGLSMLLLLLAVTGLAVGLGVGMSGRGNVSSTSPWEDEDCPPGENRPHRPRPPPVHPPVHPPADPSDPPVHPPAWRDDGWKAGGWGGDADSDPNWNWKVDADGDGDTAEPPAEDPEVPEEDSYFGDVTDDYPEEDVYFGAAADDYPAEDAYFGGITDDFGAFTDDHPAEDLYFGAVPMDHPEEDAYLTRKLKGAGRLERRRSLQQKRDASRRHLIQRLTSDAILDEEEDFDGQGRMLRRRKGRRELGSKKDSKTHKCKSAKKAKSGSHDGWGGGMGGHMVDYMAGSMSMRTGMSMGSMCMSMGGDIILEALEGAEDATDDGADLIMAADDTIPETVGETDCGGSMCEDGEMCVYVENAEPDVEPHYACVSPEEIVGGEEVL